MNIFISYNRQTKAITKALVEDVETLGHTAWFDQELSGGQAWWDQILSMIRRCDLFVFVLDPAALNSIACRRECGYAADLRKPILPILVSEGVSTNLLPPSLAQIEFVDYRNQDRTAALRLGRAFSAVPPPAALPDPLPVPPQAPLSYLGSLAAKLETTSLTYEEQIALLFDLKKGLRDPQTADDTRTLLKTFRKRRDLLADIAEEIDELVQSLRQTSSPRAAPLKLEQVAEPIFQERQETKVQTTEPQPAMLRDAWQWFAIYDANANRLQHAFRKIQFWILVLGLIAIFLALFEKQGQELVKHQQMLHNALGWLRYPIIVISIVTAILLAYYNKFRPANKWILLRGSADAIKGEIYRYRSRTGNYSKDRLTTNSLDDVFHDRLEPARHLMRTEANQSALMQYDGPLPPAIEGAQQSDDGFSFLTPERYIELRLENQLKYYSSKTPKLEKQIKHMQVTSLIAGGSGAVLAAVGAELWVALTTAMAIALTTSLASSRLQETLVRYNQSAADLANVREWWTRLSPAAKRNPKNIDQLVEVTEKVLEAELSGWVQRMEDALAQLKAEEEKGEESGGEKSQPKNEGTPPPQADTVPPKAEPADSPGHEDT